MLCSYYYVLSHEGRAAEVLGRQRQVLGVSGRAEDRGLPQERPLRGAEEVVRIFLLRAVGQTLRPEEKLSAVQEQDRERRV